jgi:hypothetical protein
LSGLQKYSLKRGSGAEIVCTDLILFRLWITNEPIYRTTSPGCTVQYLYCTYHHLYRCRWTRWDGVERVPLSAVHVVCSAAPSLHDRSQLSQRSGVAVYATQGVTMYAAQGSQCTPHRGSQCTLQRDHSVRRIRGHSVRRPGITVYATQGVTVYAAQGVTVYASSSHTSQGYPAWAADRCSASHLHGVCSSCPCWCSCLSCLHSCARCASCSYTGLKYGDSMAATELHVFRRGEPFNVRKPVAYAWFRYRDRVWCAKPFSLYSLYLSSLPFPYLK